MWDEKKQFCILIKMQKHHPKAIVLVMLKLRLALAVI